MIVGFFVDMIHTMILLTSFSLSMIDATPSSSSTIAQQQYPMPWRPLFHHNQLPSLFTKLTLLPLPCTRSVSHHHHHHCHHLQHTKHFHQLHLYLQPQALITITTPKSQLPLLQHTISHKNCAPTNFSWLLFFNSSYGPTFIIVNNHDITCPLYNVPTKFKSTNCHSFLNHIRKCDPIENHLAKKI